MTTEEAQEGKPVVPQSSLGSLIIMELLAALRERRRLIILSTLIGAILAVSVSFLLEKQYTSTVTLMPPDAQSLTTTSMLAGLGASSSSMQSLGGGLLSVRTPGLTVIGILQSATVTDNIVDRFNLKQLYHAKYEIDAAHLLASLTAIEEDKRTGIVSITVTNSDKVLARDMAQAYVEELSKLLNSLGSSSAHRERAFLEGRIATLKVDLDASTAALSSFSSRNATVNPQAQGQALYESAGKLQSDLIASQAELSSLKTTYADNNVRVLAVRARIAELEAESKKMIGVNAPPDSSKANSDTGTNQAIPSLRQLPVVGATYADLSRRVGMQEALYETLSRQYELAKVVEAKELPVVKVIDPPTIAEKKSFPHGSLFLVEGGAIAAFFSILYVLVRRLWSITDDAYPAKAALKAAGRIVKR